MKKKILAAGSLSVKTFFLFFMIILSSCAGRNNAVTHIIPGDDYHNSKPDITIDVGDITETMNGAGAANLPQWMSAYITGGIAEIEKIEFYRDRYLFIGHNEGVNFTALSKWADNYSVVRDFPRLAAARIEKKLISAASLYPDDEYGFFFETMVKKALGAEYTDAVKEDAYWIKVKRQEGNTGQGEVNGSSQVFEFFVFISIDKITMQAVIRDMTAEVIAECSPTRAQSASINRLQQNFFEVF